MGYLYLSFVSRVGIPVMNDMNGVTLGSRLKCEEWMDPFTCYKKA
jgi:hypothetical protein